MSSAASLTTRATRGAARTDTPRRSAVRVASRARACDSPATAPAFRVTLVTRRSTSSTTLATSLTDRVATDAARLSVAESDAVNDPSCPACLMGSMYILV
jgi:hypothetical protein